MLMGAKLQYEARLFFYEQITGLNMELKKKWYFILCGHCLLLV